jgi:hypothetical protein
MTASKAKNETHKKKIIKKGMTEIETLMINVDIRDVVSKTF